MKKFISLVALATLLISAVSCREAEQITDLKESQSFNLSAKVAQDSVVINSSTNTPAENTPKDPPVKDGHDW